MMKNQNHCIWHIIFITGKKQVYSRQYHSFTWITFLCLWSALLRFFYTFSFHSGCDDRPKLREHDIWAPSFQKSFLKFQLIICLHLKELKREKLRKTCKSILVTFYSKYYLCIFTSLGNISYVMHTYTKITQNPLVAIPPHKESEEELKQSSTILFSSWTF